jgi:hypothetical protein
MMDRTLRLNPLILDKIASLQASETMKKFLVDIFYLELEKSQKDDDLFTSDYEEFIEKYVV